MFSTEEQKFFIMKRLVNKPKRCHNCRVLARAHRRGLKSDRTTVVECADCQQVTRVPFVPKGHEPIYCTSCFKNKFRNERTSG